MILRCRADALVSRVEAAGEREFDDADEAPKGVARGVNHGARGGVFRKHR